MGRVRCLCVTCSRDGRGGFFSIDENEIIKALKGESLVKCPYCGSTKVKVLEKRWFEEIKKRLGIERSGLYVNPQ
ncbi:MAG: hypothetical protein DRJ40_05105 [Thermoprotei archaeon]|nr:MAG: hypothetical protein DRJ40_04420 [Thermoprotei archaeon]RLE56776.1 MAG: hypothetical protein DRJ40_05105 [Thermoprotei archaeon]